MEVQKTQRTYGQFWKLVQQQHGVATRQQMLALGFNARGIDGRIARGRLHPIWSGVYAVGRPEVSQHGRWMAATLTCGHNAVLSHESAAALLKIRDRRHKIIEISTPGQTRSKRPGIRTHRRSTWSDSDYTEYHGIPVTSPAVTLVDLAARLSEREIEAAINEADKYDLISPGTLRASLDQMTRRPGLGTLKNLLDRQTFVRTRSDLERAFLPIARRIGLPTPATRIYINGFEVDFFWPHLGLVIETDGPRFHRTPGQQAKDTIRDQTHTASGLTPLRFTHSQIYHEPKYVEKTLSAVASRITNTQNNN